MQILSSVFDRIVDGDYFLLFLVFLLVILVVLIFVLTAALFNSRKEEKRGQNILGNLASMDAIDDEKEATFESIKEDNSDNPLDALNDLMALSDEDKIEEDKPLSAQFNIKTYDDIINDYESSEEETAVISADELLKRTQERNETLGVSDNQDAIAKYEEEQEKKAIISYEQLLKNASNVTLTYTDETKNQDGPKINKIEVEQKEVTASEMYIKEEEFLQILKEFRVSL